MKTGDHKIVDEWVNSCWPESVIKVIEENIPDYKSKIKPRTANGCPTISDIGDTFQLIINYNTSKNCFIVWNAAVQKYIHSGKKIKPSLGKAGEKQLHEIISPTSIIPLFREIRCEGSNQVELIHFVGSDAMKQFCKEYENLIKPNPDEIPKGKTCIYAVAGNEPEYIKSGK